MHLPDLRDHSDLMKKATHDFNRYEANNNTYELMDCILTLNALPEWIQKSATASIALKNEAAAKEEIMKDGTLEIDENNVGQNLNQLLRLIRLISNHSKHNKSYSSIPIVIQKAGSEFPATFPVKFHNIIAIGNNELDAEYFIQRVYDYWVETIKELG